MHPNDFGAKAPGSVAEIPQFCGAQYCFQPAPLPPAWPFPNKLWPRLVEAKEQLMLLEGIGRTLPNPALILRPLRDREAILSSRMEGTYATARQLLLYELDPTETTSLDDPRNPHREVANYARALDHAAASRMPICLTFIRQLHEILMHGVHRPEVKPGEFRKGQVAIGRQGAAPRFVPPSPERLHDSLGELDAYLHRDHWEYDPLVECFLAHYQFETMHPFLDGNGRVGRLLLTVMVQRLCGMTQPWLHMSEYFEKDHRKYCEQLLRVSTRGAWADWIEYCLAGVADVAKRTIVRCDRLRQLRAEFNARLPQTGAIRLHEIVEQLFRTPVVTVVGLTEELGVTYPTAKSDIKKLQKVNILSELPDHSPKTYYAPEVFAIGYEGLDE